MQARKPLLVMPRRFDLSEHRCDHQQTTVAQMQKYPGIYPVETRDDILALLRKERLVSPTVQKTPECDRLISGLRKAIFDPDE